MQQSQIKVLIHTTYVIAYVHGVHQVYISLNGLKIKFILGFILLRIQIKGVTIIFKLFKESFKPS